MTRTVAEFETAGGKARFDVDDIAGVGPEQVSRRGDAVVAKLDQSLEAAIADARPAAQAVLDTFKALAPDDVTVEFGIRVDAEAGAVIARAGVEAHFTVTLTWSSEAEGRPT